MPLKVYVRPNELTSPLFAEAFAAGCGGEVCEQYQGGPWAGFGSPDNWRDLQAAIEGGFDWYFGDHAYFGRHHFYRISKNQYQHNGRGHSDCRRFKWHGIEIKSRQHGKNVLICPQSEVFFALRGMNRDFWFAETLAEIQKHTDRPIVVRTKKDPKPFSRQLEKAHCVVTYSSNAAVEAILAGVPAICLHNCAASVMAESKIENIENPYFENDRLEWAGVLADNQWTLDEIKSGMAWRALNV